MKVTKIIENEDGSANLEIDLTPDELQFIVEIGITTCITKGMVMTDCCGGECEGNCDSEKD